VEILISYANYPESDCVSITKEFRKVAEIYMYSMYAFHYHTASIGFQQPVHIATSSYRKLYCDRTSNFLNCLNQ
jgi:hypothetical protein